MSKESGVFIHKTGNFDLRIFNLSCIFINQITKASIYKVNGLVDIVDLSFSRLAQAVGLEEFLELLVETNDNIYILVLLDLGINDSQLQITWNFVLCVSSLSSLELLVKDLEHRNVIVKIFVIQFSQNISEQFDAFIVIDIKVNAKSSNSFLNVKVIKILGIFTTMQVLQGQVLNSTEDNTVVIVVQNT